MAYEPKRRGRATLVEHDGGRIRFDFAEVSAHVQSEIATLTAKDQPTKADVDALAAHLVKYMVNVCTSVRLTTKYKPWKDEATSDAHPSNSAYRKGYYDGWSGLQYALRFEMICE